MDPATASISRRLTSFAFVMFGPCDRNAFASISDTLALATPHAMWPTGCCKVERWRHTSGIRGIG